MKTFKLLPRLFAVFGMTIMFTVSGWSLASSVSGVTATQLANAIQGPGITITNPVLFRSNSQQAGTFSNGISGAKLEIDSGIILTTMSVAEAFTTNSSGSTSVVNGNTYEDNDLKSIDAKAKYDTVIFTFDVTLGANTKLLTVDYQFASEEYNEYVGSQYNDAFGFFVYGGDLTKTYNIARVVSDTTIVTTANIGNYAPVTINNVNNGSLGGNADGTATILTNTQYFIDNTPNNKPVDVEFDGLTHRLHATLDNLTPGVTYHFKMALADTGDNQLDTGVFVNKIMGIRGPQMCYDYSYKQNSQYITNKKYLGLTPRIDSSVIPNTQIDVSIYIKNQESSELTAENLKMSITDINTSQATYIPQSVQVLLPGSSVVTPIADNSNGMSVANGYIKNIPIGSVLANQYFYTNYAITPLVGDLNISLDADISFNLMIQGISIPFNSKIGSSQLPMCVASATYSPASGIYNMVDQRANITTLSAGSTTVKNNLPTQVANRPTTLEIVSYDPTNLNSVKASNTMLAVEMIDVAGFYDTNASCYNPNAAITKRAWVQFGDVDANVTYTDFGSTLLGTGLNVNLSSDDFYKNIRENVAFRLSYNLGDNNGSIQIDKLANGNYKLTNFTTVAAGNTCQSGFVPSNGNSMSVASYCGSNGTGNGTGMDTTQLRDCMECIYGKKTSTVCSRDNFSIRPEALKVNITDGAITIPSDANLSAKYSYRFDINATNHLNSVATPGYVALYSSKAGDMDRNATLVWAPNGRVVTGCNDTSSPKIDFYFVNGQITNQMRDHNNTGRYQLQLRDQKWTSVDKATPSHHIGTTNWLAGGDCTANFDSVPLYSNSNTYTDNMVGCVTSSQHSKLSTPIEKFNDFNLSFRPDHFTLSPMSMSTGMTFNTTAINQNTWTYMNNVNTDANMSVRYSGQIIAHGDNNETLSNFVTNCYAQPVNLDLNLTFPTTAGLPNWRYRLQEINTSVPAIWRDMNAVIAAPITNTNFNLLTVPESGFLKNRSGLVDMNLSINFDRNQTLPINPITVGLGNLQVKCQTSSACQSIADGSVNHLPDVNLTTNSNVTFAYGRLLTKDIRVFGPIAFTANGWYEVFNLPIFQGVSLQRSKDDASWYINRGHDDALHGDANVTRLISSSVADSTIRGGLDNNAGTDIFPFAAINPIYNGKAHVRTLPWLWYAPNALIYSDPSVANPANAAGNDAACVTHPCFNVTVMPTIGATGSAKGGAEGNKASKQSVGGGAWRSTTDYSPAIR